MVNDEVKISIVKNNAFCLITTAAIGQQATVMNGSFPASNLVIIIRNVPDAELQLDIQFDSRESTLMIMTTWSVNLEQQYL